MSRRLPKRPLIEWIFGAVSAGLVVALVGFLAWEAVFAGSRPPELVLELTSVEPAGNGTTVKIAIANRGDEAASAVIVQASAQDASGGEPLQKQIEFDYVPGHGTRYGAFIMPGKVAAEGIRIEIGGYAEP